MKRTLSFLLTLLMLVTSLPLNAFTVLAEELTAEETSPLAGKTISILGASISTYAGTSNGKGAETTNSTIAGNVKYYPNTTIPEVTLEDTWWMQTAEDLGLRLLVNNAWSGSAILTERSGTVGAYVDRCVQLHDDTGENAGEEPDIICIQMGFNDFSYGKDTLGNAEIDYDALITADGYGTPSTTMEATAIMLHKMTKRYPNAEIYMFNHFKRIGQSASDTALMEELNASIETVCARYGVAVVDLYSTLTDPKHIGDGKLHPNRLGMDVITEAVKTAILENTKYTASCHTVSMALENATADYGTDKLVMDGDGFTLHLESPDELRVSVTMGGKDVTSSVYADGAISIPAVTGDVKITAKGIHLPKHYRWEFDGTDLVAAIGDNTLTKTAGTTAEGVFSDTMYDLASPIVLRHDLPWQVEWKCQGTWKNSESSSGGRLFTSTPVNAEYNARYLFKSATKWLIAMGEKTTTGSHNYGIALEDYGIDGSALHTYRLENRVAADGSNMVYLFLDGKEIGAMNHYYVGTTDKKTTSDWLSGKDFTLPYFGTDTHGLTNCSIEYVEVWENIHPASESWPVLDTDLTHIICYGQSFSTGSDAPLYPDPAVEGVYVYGGITSGKAGDALKTLEQITGTQHPVISAGNSLQQRLQQAGIDTDLVLGSYGSGGKTIAQLMSEARQAEIKAEEGYDYDCLSSGRYEVFQASVSALADYAAAEGQTVSCPVIIYLQGETDQNTDAQLGYPENPIRAGYGAGGDKEKYKEYMTRLKEDMQKEVMEAYGQREKPLFLIYQVSGTYVRTQYSSINMAQLEFAQENDDVLLVQTPYFTSHYTGSHHLTVNGYRWLGEHIARTMYDALVDREKTYPLLPEEIAYESDNTIRITVSGGEGGLSIDTYTVENASNSGNLYGFTVYVNEKPICPESVTVTGDGILLTLPKSTLPLSKADSVYVYYGGKDAKGTGNIRDNCKEVGFYQYLDDSNDIGTGKNQSVSYSALDKDGHSLIGQSYPLYRWLASFCYELEIPAEEQKQNAFYHWELQDNGLVSISGDQNELTLLEGTVENGILNGVQYAMEETVVLLHHKPWAIEWKAAGNGNSYGGGMLLAADDGSGSGAGGLYLPADSRGMIAWNLSGKGRNCGIRLNAFNIDTRAEHIYRIENRISSDGTNTVYLLVDGVEKGDMNTAYSTSDGSLIENPGNWANGTDIYFRYLGKPTAFLLKNMKLSYLKVWECDHSYQSTVTPPTATTQGYTTYTCTACGDSHVSDYTDKLENLWSGRSAVFVGDSITAGVGTTKLYYQFLEEALDFSSVTAMGVGGSCFSAASDYGQKNQPLINRYQSIPTADLIVIFMGTNDYGHETPLGTLSDTRDGTFYGALNTIIPALVQKHTSSKIVFVTSLHRYGLGTSGILGTAFTYDHIPNGVGATLGDYVNALKTVCANNGVAVIDLYTECTLDPTDAEVRATYMPDGLHPNAAGHEVIAGIMESHILGYTPVAEEPISVPEMIQGNKFASGNTQPCRASSYANYYLKAGDVITLKNPDVMQWACAKTSGEYTTDNLGYFPEKQWTDITTAVVAEDGWIGFTFKYRDETQSFDLTRPLSDFITIHTHVYTATVTKPTCTEQGYTTYTCAVCGDSYVEDETEAAGHSYTSITTQPTATTQGYTTYTCEVCGDSYVADYTDFTGFDSYQEAVKYLREQMVARVPSVTVRLYGVQLDENQVYNFRNDAWAHTGVPYEGDYIRQNCLATSCSSVTGTDDKGIYTEMYFNTTWFTTAAQEAEVDAAVADLLAEWNLESATDYQKIKCAYDWVCTNVVYDHDNLYDSTYLLKHSSYAALIHGKAVCQGFASLFYRLCLELGVDCRVITGQTDESHAWNIVKLGDKYYNMDPTYDRGTGNYYRYFLTPIYSFGGHDRNAEYETDAFNAAYPMATLPYVEKVAASGTLSNGMEWILDG
ncbi:MAG: hypothetical protein IJW34_01420, partial [Clostridia bacterium]|nr:hypothetical protein [Clostridia bacterium]